MLQTRCLALVFTFFTVASSLVIQQRQAVTTSSVRPSSTITSAPTPKTTTSTGEIGGFESHTVTHTAIEFEIPAETTSAAPTPTSNFDDNKEGIPPPDPDPKYYEDEGAGGKSDGFIDVSIGAQAGIIIAIVVVGLAIMVGCIIFWSKKKKEWKAALERRRTLRASRRSMAAAVAASSQAAGGTKAKKGSDKAGATQSGSSTSSVNSTEVRVVERSQFDVMTPVAPENPWWKKALGKK
ncbi:hypothetical protein DFH27DRAFT_522581 [Peziza echinospora]|nr:hypothetical protein DFH27DRAFT_522581 [Peziza echinospora]